MKRLLSVSLILALAIALAPFLLAGDFDYTAKEIGTQVINPVASTALTVPDGTQWITFSVDTKPVHISFDGTAATTSDQKFPTGPYRTPRDPALVRDLRFIDSAEGASTVYVKFWRRR